MDARAPKHRSKVQRTGSPARCASIRCFPRARRLGPLARALVELLPDVLEGPIEPGRVFDRTAGINDVPAAYRTMDERKAIKVMVKP